MTEPLTSDHGKWRYDGLGVIFDEKNRRVAYLHNEQAGKRGDDTLKRIVDAVNNSANLRAQILAMQQTQSAEVVDLRAQLAQAMQSQEQLAANVNLGLLEIRTLKAELAQVVAELAQLESQMTNKQTGFSPYIRQLEAELIEAKDRTIPALEQQLAQVTNTLSVERNNGRILNEVDQELGGCNWSTPLEKAKRVNAELLSLRQKLAQVTAKTDAEMLRVKACEHIAEGEEGWGALRNECPSTIAVANLRDQLDIARRLVEGLNRTYTRKTDEIASLTIQLAEAQARLFKLEA